ncbi:MAG TPA: DnaA N-terminal domain-containing protein [Anaerolineaceae bacterium]|nr:DnaA N-terminal domain-containing protein [Anaerolineaceae bacterium]
MESNSPSQILEFSPADIQQVWEAIKGQLRADMDRSQFETWVQPLQALRLQDQVFTLATVNAYARDWVDSRLRSRITQLATGFLNQPVSVRIIVSTEKAESARPEPASPPEQDEPEKESAPPPSARKLMLHRAYGSKRASVIQPERGLFITMYLLQNWSPLLSSSAMMVILAARSMCYWNPKTGELRNTIDTEMGELARRAAVSVRTVKDILNQPLIKQYFLRYKVRRIFTSNGVRTAGISMMVRMDDPLTPEHQEEFGLPEEPHWYGPDFMLEDEEDK